jgi:hypothetical protein
MPKSYTPATAQMLADVNSFASASKDGISMLCLLPWISSTIYESANVLGVSAAGSSLDKIDTMIRECRHRAKLFDGSPKSVDDFAREFDAIVASHRDFFLGQPVRFRALSKYLITDLGVIYLEDRVLATTHVFQYLLGGMNPSVYEFLQGDGSLALSVGRRLGANLAQIGAKLGLSLLVLEQWSILNNHTETKFGFIDTKSTKFYAKLTKEESIESRQLGQSVTLFSTLANTANSLAAFGVRDESTQLRVKFLTLYAISNSARRLLGRKVSEERVSKPILESLRFIAYSKSFRAIAGSKPLRNALVHYSIPRELVNLINPEEDTFVQIADAFKLKTSGLYDLANLNSMLEETIEAFGEIWPTFFVKPQLF